MYKLLNKISKGLKISELLINIWNKINEGLKISELLRNIWNKINEGFEISKRLRNLWGKFTLFFCIDYHFHKYQINIHTKKYAYIDKNPTTTKRIIWILIFAIPVLLLPNLLKDFEWLKIATASNNIAFINLAHMVIISPILFIIWAFRDHNRLRELDNTRKDTNLKEFQQLQEWATGNDNTNVALQISALHSLRGYLKGEYGENFRRGAFEIFASALHTQHKKILEEAGRVNKINIQNAIANNELCKQLNRIIEEDWFNFLINHNFPTATLSLVGVNLSAKYLRHKQYGERLNLSHANLQGANLYEAKLQGAYLYDAKLQGADLRFAQLQWANLSWAKLQGAHLIEAKLQGADLSVAKLQGADLSWTQLQGAYLNLTKLQGANLSWVQLQGADLQKAQLQGVNLQGADLQGVNLRKAKLQGANLSGAQLQGADLSWAQLQGADLNGAKLQGAYISREYEDFNFSERIKQQTNKSTETDALGTQYQTLSAEQKTALIDTLNGIDTYLDEDAIERIKDAIKRIENATYALDLTKVITGEYDKKQAQKWIEQYQKNS